MGGIGIMVTYGYGDTKTTEFITFDSDKKIDTERRQISSELAMGASFIQVGDTLYDRDRIIKIKFKTGE